MTYDQWFRSQQGIPYEGQYLFAEAAWTHQLTRIINLHEENKQLREALSVAIEAMEDFDYDKRMAAIAKCREVLK